MLPSTPSGASEVFGDDFTSGTDLNTTIWNAATGYSLTGTKVQMYMPENVFIRNGSLHLLSRHGRYNSIHDYSSGRVDTGGKFSFLYGEIEWRVQVPTGQGLQPGLVLLPASCPNVLESVCLPAVTTEYRSDGYQHRENLMTTYWNASTAGGNRKAGMWEQEKLVSEKIDLSLDFHVYKLNWTQASLVWSLDGKEIFKETNPQRIPTIPMQIVLQLITEPWTSERAPKLNPPTSQLLVDYVVVRQSGNQNANFFYKPMLNITMTTPGPIPVFTREILRDDFKTDAYLNDTIWTSTYYGSSQVIDEDQKFTPDNVFVKNGSLHLQATVSSATVRSATISSDEDPYTVGRVFTKGKFDFLYGEVEWRASFPNAAAAIPGVFLVRNDNEIGLPFYGEEMTPIVTMLTRYRRDPMSNYVSGLMWKNGTSGEVESVDRTLDDLSAEFHVFKLVWLPTSLTWYIDGKEVFQVTDPTAIPSVRMQISMYLAMCKTTLDTQGDPKVNLDVLIDYIVVRQL